MAQPPAYTRNRDFSDWQAANPQSHINGADLDAEFDEIKAVLDAIRTNLALIQRDDGELANESVSVDQLADPVIAGVNPPTVAWATGVAFGKADTIIDNGKWYLCLVAHTAGAALATDVAAGKWRLINDFGNLSAATPADNSVTTAKIVDGAVTTAKLADTSVTTAKIVDANVTAAKLAADSVETAKIKDANVTTAKIADANVTTAKIADSGVTTAKIAGNAVTAAKESNDDWAEVIAAATVDLGAQTSRRISLVGTTTVTSFGTAPAGTVRLVKFNDSPSIQITHNATSLKLPGGANIIALNGDTFWAISRGSGNWEVFGYNRGDGAPLKSDTINGLLVPGAELTLNPYAVNTSASQAHGLPVRPDLINAVLRCNTAELNWLVGDEIFVPLTTAAFSVWADTTNVYLITHASTLPQILNKTTRALVSITAANWRLMLTPFWYRRLVQG